MGPSLRRVSDQVSARRRRQRRRLQPKVNRAAISRTTRTPCSFPKHAAKSLFVRVALFKQRTHSFIYLLIYVSVLCQFFYFFIFKIVYLIIENVAKEIIAIYC